MDEQQPQWKPTLGLGIAVAALLFLGWGILNPGFVNGDRGAHLNTIANNLRILEGAKEQYALEYQLAASAPVTEADLLPYLKDKRMVRQAVGEMYTITNVGTLITATLTRGPVAGKTGPFTVTSF
jgi:hypothetical protein